MRTHFIPASSETDRPFNQTPRLPAGWFMENGTATIRHEPCGSDAEARIRESIEDARGAMFVAAVAIIASGLFTLALGIGLIVWIRR